MFLHTWTGRVLALDPLPTPSPIAAECVLWEFLEVLSWSPLCSVCTSLSSPLVMDTVPAALTGEYHCPSHHCQTGVILGDQEPASPELGS